MNFEHKLYAHCENGVIGNLLRFYGHELSEPMVFGLAYGLFFCHLPFIKLAGLPVTSFRTFPGVLFKRVMPLLGFKVRRERFLSQEHAMQALDKKLASGVPVGCVVGMYYLPYMPIEYRFPFNGHNICVFGKQGDDYLVSDPICTQPVTISSADLIRSRFAKGGTYPLYGLMYWVEKSPKELPNLRPLIFRSILKDCWYMLSQPSFLPWVGVRGIAYLARRMRKWPQELTQRQVMLNLAQIIRMLEEIGTGGSGFRFIYGAFLQECASVTGMPEFHDFSARITAIGDKWRRFSSGAAAYFKRRPESPSIDQLADIIDSVANDERAFFCDLQNFCKANKPG